MSTQAPGFLRRFLIGPPIHTERAHHERLSPLLGLPVFSSDALSSVAYATEAILSVLVLHSVLAVHYQFPITIGICCLIVLVVISYQQTIRAYPNGGGSYIVASDNLGETPGLLAGAALLIDYVLTVAVSVAAGVLAITSAYSALHPYLLLMCAACVAVIAWANLRGVRESGAAFAVPTYGFIAGMVVMIVAGVFKASQGVHSAPQITVDQTSTVSMTLLFLVARSFSAGCTALTGIEAVSNGVQAFRAPEPKNAIMTLRIMAVMLVFMFVGTGYLSQHLPSITLFATKNPHYETLVSQIAAWTFGRGTFGYLYIQLATAAILILAANTAFADFPRLASLLSRDGYLPRPLSRQGDRLVFHNGIIALSVAALALIWMYHGELDLLLPLYAVGVFTAFTLSQLGMVQHWRKLQGPGWHAKAFLNGLGAIATAIVTAVIMWTKFVEGAWIVLILLTIFYIAFKATKSRYSNMADQLAIGDNPLSPATGVRSLLLVPRVHRGILKALDVARSLDSKCEAVHVTIDDRKLPEIQREWEAHGGNVPLSILPSPYRSLISPVLEYVDEVLTRDSKQMLVVIVAEAVSTKWYQRLLQENLSAQLKSALGQRQNVAVLTVRYFLV